MKSKIFISSLLLILFCGMSERATAQKNDLKENYLGFIPSFLVEPYDTINAVEVNFLPLLYEYRMGNGNSVGLQLRPILNYRFLKDQSGFSQLGFTAVANKYFAKALGENHWLKPQLGLYYTYAYNLLDEIQTMTLGIEPGVFMEVSESFSLSVNLQPGINYYPDKFSQDFVKTRSGFRGHFGVVVHVGYNF